MVKWLSLITILLGGLALPSGSRAAPLEAYGQLPYVEQLEISPDGELLAQIYTTGDTRIMAVTRNADGKVLDQVSMGQMKVRDLAWAGNKNLLITKSVAQYVYGLENGLEEWLLAYDYNIETKKTWKLLEPVAKESRADSRLAGGDGMNVVLRPPTVRLLDGRPAILLHGLTFASNRGVPTVFRTELDSNAVRTLAVGDARTRTLVIGAEGEVVAQSAYDDRTGRWSLKFKDGPAWREKGVTTALIDRPNVLGLGRDGKSVLVLRNTSDDSSELVEASSDGAWSEPVAPAAAALRPFFDPVRHNLIGYQVLRGDETTTTFFDPDLQKAWRSILAAFPGDQVTLKSWSHDRQKMILRVDSPKEGPAYALFDRTKRTATWLGLEYNRLRPQDISPVRPIAFKAQDGLSLTGYLTLPHGAEAKNLPLVVFPHGGPAERDFPGFDWWAQAMASRGYAVLQVNFRGSAGLSWDLAKAGFGEWGRKMQTDLSDGVRHFVKEGVIDPKRVCIVGASYGGYAALAGATIDKGVYRCAASYSGVTDLPRLMGAEIENSKHAVRNWKRFMGIERFDDPVLVKISPARLAAEADIPVLLIHGKDDTVVPLSQSQLMANALKKAGKPVELVVLKGEDHWLTSGETRLAMLQAVVGFLEKHNPPR